MRGSRLLLVSLALLVGCDEAGGSPDGGPLDGGEADGGRDAGRVYVPAPFEPTAATRAYCGEGDDDAIEARITEMLAQLSLREKATLMHGAQLAIVDGTWQVEGNARLGIPGLHMLDGPRGLSAFNGQTGTAFPVAMMRGATFDPALEREVGAAMGVELRSVGADVLLAPTINILRHPRWGRAQETYSEDVHHMGEMGVAFIRGVQSEGILASAKHFAVNSIDDTRHDVDVIIDERTLREIYLPHFRRAVVDAHVGSVMSAYNQVNGLYCDLNGHLLREILKDEWGFAGFVESDWVLGTHGHAPAVRAGLDIEMPSGSNFRRLPGAVDLGEIEEAEIDDAVRRIVRAQLCFGLDTRAPVVDGASMRETPEHLALARRVATRGIVLLENRPADGAPADAPDTLPLDRGALSQVVVLGRVADLENIGDDGSSNVRASDVVTALEGLRERAAGVTFTLIDRAALTTEDEAAVGAADAVIVVTGLTAEDEGESTIGAGDRDSLALPAEEVALIHAASALSNRVVVVLEGGAAITVADWVDEVEALVMAFYPGSQGGLAIADVLFGDVSPAGRLPFSVPVDEADLPPFDNVSFRVTYDYFHGYRHLERNGVAPQYPFGFGRSYTRFDYENLTLSSSSLSSDGVLTVSVSVRNVGDVRGRETVQLYVSAAGSSVERAPQDLRAFGQVELAPGEAGTVELTLPASDLAFYDVAASAWTVEPIDYEVRVGSFAGDVRLAETFAVE